MINSTHGVFGGVFKIWGLILKFWKASVLACDQQINRSEPFAVGKVFQNMRINPHFLKNLFFFFCKESALYIHAYELKCELLLVLVMMTFSTVVVRAAWYISVPNSVGWLCRSYLLNSDAKLWFQSLSMPGCTRRKRWAGHHSLASAVHGIEDCGLWQHSLTVWF